MNVLYTSLLFLYYFLVKIASLYNAKAYSWINNRKNWRMLLSQKRKKDEKWIWFHCSSLGEYEDSCEIFHQVIKDNPLKKTILTFFSPSGYEAKKNSDIYSLVMYLPLDTKKNSKYFLDILQPEAIFFSRSELWFNFISQINKRNIPFFLLSLKLTKKNNFLKWPFILKYGKCFRTFNHIFCQNEITKKILKNKFDINCTSITGNPRFDRIYAESLSGKNIPYIENFIKDSFVIVAGSTLLKDETIILSVLEQLRLLNLTCIIVPHEIDRERMDMIIKENKSKFIRYSEIELLSISHTVLYLDYVGDLKHLYRFADFAIIGGGFDKIGIHNIVEPAVYGVKTTFGPKHKNYSEALDLIKIGGCRIYNNKKELYEIILNEYNNPKDEILKEEIGNYVKMNTGGSVKILEIIRSEFPNLI